MGILQQMVTGPVGIVGSLTMGVLALETIGMSIWAERHRRSAIRLRTYLVAPPTGADPVSYRLVKAEAARYLADKLRRTVSALGLAEDINPKAGLLFTFAAVGSLLPNFVDLLISAPGDALAQVAPAIWTSVFGISNSVLAGIQRHRLNDECVALEQALEPAPRDVQTLEAAE